MRSSHCRSLIQAFSLILDPRQLAVHDYCGCGLSEVRNIMGVVTRRDHGDISYVPSTLTSINFSGVNYATGAGVIDAQTLVAYDSESDFFLEFFLQQQVMWGRSFQFWMAGGVAHGLTNDAVWATFTFLPDSWLSCVCAFLHLLHLRIALSCNSPSTTANYTRPGN